MSTRPPSDPLLSLRSAFILLLAVLAGLAVGVLTYAAKGSPASAVLAGLGATAAVLVAAPQLIS